MNSAIDQVINGTVQTMSHIKLDQVCKSFGDKLVLDQISLEINRGDFVALIGPSGCGKSTLLRILAQLTVISSGSLEISKAEDDQLGYVFQDATLLPWMNILSNTSLPLKLSGVGRQTREQKAAEMLQLVGLESVSNLYPRELSGGMRMRASIARALAKDPEILLLDEPFGALDEMTRDDLNEELLHLREQQDWTGVFVTHSVMEAVFLSNKIVVMSANPGRISEIIEVDLPYPRSIETRTSEHFQKKLAEVTKSLHNVRQKG